MVNQFKETPNQLSAIAISANSVGNNEIDASVNMDLESKLNWNLEGNRNQIQMHLAEWSGAVNAELHLSSAMVFVTSRKLYHGKKEWQENKGDVW
ncbi:hypothetical protein L2E82_31891 [Cichorium intybus]|uniref:Uncharacterized protein n=1 Tax=Cichorium intybus TaxID=13427 RepID=A0ACB9BG15_CICIN|nr:hypothetical protein L2E82_31891 [Cichorium intybus]